MMKFESACLTHTLCLGGVCGPHHAPTSDDEGIHGVGHTTAVGTAASRCRGDVHGAGGNAPSRTWSGNDNNSNISIACGAPEHTRDETRDAATTIDLAPRSWLVGLWLTRLCFSRGLGVGIWFWFWFRRFERGRQPEEMEHDRKGAQELFTSCSIINRCMDTPHSLTHDLPHTHHTHAQACTTHACAEPPPPDQRLMYW